MLEDHYMPGMHDWTPLYGSVRVCRHCRVLVSDWREEPDTMEGWEGGWDD